MYILINMNLTDEQRNALELKAKEIGLVKGFKEIIDFIGSNKAKDKIEYKDSNEYEQEKSKIQKFEQYLVKEGYNIKFNYSGRIITFEYLYQIKGMEKQTILPGDLNLQPELEINERAIFSVYLSTRNLITKNKNKKIIQLFKSEEDFYNYYKINFIDKLNDYNLTNKKIKILVLKTLLKMFKVSTMVQVDIIINATFATLASAIKNKLYHTLKLSTTSELNSKLKLTHNLTDLEIEEVNVTFDINVVDSLFTLTDTNSENLIKIIMVLMDNIEKFNNYNEMMDYLHNFSNVIIPKSRKDKEPLKYILKSVMNNG